MDADGNVYLDFQNNYTALVHGHQHPAVMEGLRDTLENSVVFNAPIELQRQLAQTIRDRVASVDLVRFTNSGTEAVMNALRLARAHTGRPRILKMEGAFHGSYDGVALSVHPGIRPPDWPTAVPENPGLAPGSPDGVLVAPYNDLERTSRIVKEHCGELAAVIVEALTWAPGGIPASLEFLSGLETLCRGHDIVFILDEVVTFRLAEGGAQALYGVTPDLTVFGKAIGGGLPIGALAGRRDLMSRLDPRHGGYLPQSGTFSGSPLSMAAGLAALELLDDATVLRMNEQGEALRSRLASTLAGEGISCTLTGYGSLGYLHLGHGPVTSYRDAAPLNKRAHRWLHLALLTHGILMDSRGHFALSSPMGDQELEAFVDGLSKAMDGVRPLLDPDREKDH